MDGSRRKFAGDGKLLRPLPEINPGQLWEDHHMFKSVSAAAITLAVSAACIVLLPPSKPVGAQAAGQFVNAVDLDIVPAERDNFLAAIRENGAASVKEPGCKRFDIVNLNSDPNHFFLYEVYDNEAALKAHRETDHFKKYAATTGKMVAKREARQMSVIASNAK
jgi:(4S)-4-hydroxy-5-phosphonooxypentane-2,3-dione isomerase